MLRISFQISILFWIKIKDKENLMKYIHGTDKRHDWIGLWWQWSQNICRGQLVGNLDSLLSVLNFIEAVTLIG